jgi:hypothetical protein
MPSTPSSQPPTLLANIAMGKKARMRPVNSGPTVVEENGDAGWTIFVEHEMQQMSKFRAALYVKALNTLKDHKDEVFVVQNAGPDLDGVYVQQGKSDASQSLMYQSMHPYRQVWLGRKNGMVFVVAAERLDSVMQWSNLDFTDPVLPRGAAAQYLNDFPQAKHVLLCCPESDAGSGIVDAGAVPRKVHSVDDSAKCTIYMPEVLSFDSALERLSAVGPADGYNASHLKWGRYLFDKFEPLINSHPPNNDVLPAFTELLRLMNDAENNDTDFQSDGARENVAAIDGQLNLVGNILHMVDQDGSDAAYSVTLNAAQFMLQVFNECSQAAQPTISRVGAILGESSIYGIFLENRDGFVRGAFKPKQGGRWESGETPAFTGQQIEAAVQGMGYEQGITWKSLDPDDWLVRVCGTNSINLDSCCWDVKFVTRKGKQLKFENLSEKPGEQYGGEELTDDPTDEILKAPHFSFGANSGKEIVDFQTFTGLGVGCTLSQVGYVPELQRELLSLLRWRMTDTVRLLAKLSKDRQPQERKYAFQLVSAMGFTFLEEFQDLREQVLTMDFPTFWDRSIMAGIDVGQNSGLRLDPSLKGKNWFAQVQLHDSDLALFQKLFDQTFVQKYTRDRRGGRVPDSLQVVRGWRCQNLQNWAEYQDKKESILRNLQQTDGLSGRGGYMWTDAKPEGVLPEIDARFALDADVNERFLFHGTSAVAAGLITKGDFRIDKAGSNAGTLYGRGIYLAESCAKSDEYTTPDDDDLRYLLIVRSCLGRMLYTAEASPDVDQLVNSCVSGLYDSVLGDREKCRGTFKEIMVYDDTQAYPEYIIVYRRAYQKSR